MKRTSCCVLLLCLALAGCGDPESRFEAAQKEGTIAAYQGFVDAYPDHPLAAQARATLARLEWEAIKDGDDLGALTRYVDRYPDTENQAAARGKIEELEFAAVTRDSSIAAVQAYLDKYPGSPHRAELADEIAEIAFQGARRENTVPAWQAFLSQHSGSTRGVEGVDAVLAAVGTGGDFEISESLATGTGLMELAPDGSIESYPDGTILSITIKDTESGVSCTKSGSYATMIDGFALFELPDAQYWVRLPSGFLAPCFCGVLSGPGEDLTAEQQLFERWRLHRLQQMVDFVNENQDSHDAEIISTLGALQIPHARRQIDALLAASSPQVQKLAQETSATWAAIRARGCS